MAPAGLLQHWRRSLVHRLHVGVTVLRLVQANVIDPHECPNILVVGTAPRVELQRGMNVAHADLLAGRRARRGPPRSPGRGARAPGRRRPPPGPVRRSAATAPSRRWCPPSPRSPRAPSGSDPAADRTAASRRTARVGPPRVRSAPAASRRSCRAGARRRSRASTTPDAPPGRPALEPVPRRVPIDDSRAVSLCAP